MEFDVGQSVRARDRLWQVQEIKGEQRATLLHLRSMDREDPVEPMWVAVPPEHVDVVDPTVLSWPKEGLGSLASWQATHAALELSMNHGPGTLMSLLSSRVRLEPYQLEPVVRSLEMGVPRLLVADDVGLGKTVEAGLIMMELMARGLADSVLVVTPAGLTYQWQDEMRTKFGVDFEVYDRGRMQDVARTLPKGSNPWDYRQRIITSVDFVKRDGVGGVRRYLEDRRWDLVIVDEAHYLAPTTSITGTKSTDRSRFGEVLAANARSLVLLTATPHNGHAASLASLLRLLDPSISEGVLQDASGASIPRRTEKRLKKAVKERIIRRLKYEVVRQRSDGETAPYPTPTTTVLDLGAMPPATRQAYAALTDYADGEWRKADTELKTAEGSRKGELIAVQFAMSILKRRFLSSPAAFLKSVEHRLNKLAETPVTIEAHRGLLREFNEGVAQTEEDEEAIERELLTAPLDVAQANRDAELVKLQELERQAAAVLDAGEDTKLDSLRTILQGDHPDFPLTEGERVIVFTEYRDTLAYLQEALEGSEEEPGPLHGQVAMLHGGINTRAGREAAFAKFGEEETKVLLATDAVREGFNLQDYANKVLHYETPWNPNRMEQRNGRVDRWGQERPVMLGLFHYPDTYESHILTRVAERISRIREDLGSCSDFLGTLAVRDLESALMSGRPRSPEQVNLLGASIIEETEDALDRWRQQSLLVATPFTEREHRALTTRAQEADAILPEYADVRAFFNESLEIVGGAMSSLDADGRLWRITVPRELQSANGGNPVLEPATFDRETAVANKQATFITPVHPLTRALVQMHRSRIYSGSGEGRTSYRIVQDGTADGYLFTFTARLHNVRHQAVKDVLIPVFVGHDLTVSRDEGSNRKLLDQPGLSKNVPADRKSVLIEYRDEFEEALRLARDQAHEHLKWHYKALHDEVQQRRETVLNDLDQVRDQERRLFEQRYDGAQQRIDVAGQRERAREEKRLQKFLDELDERRALLADMWTLRPLDDLRLVPVGCLLLIPEVALG